MGFGLGFGLGFGFAVAHLALVQVGDPLRHLERQPREQLRGERRGRAVGGAGAGGGVGARLVQQVVERAAGEILEDDGGEALLHARAKEGADRGVAQLAQDAHLLGRARARVRGRIRVRVNLL